MRKTRTIILLLVFVFLFHPTFSLTCNIFNGPCPSDYNCLFSLYSTQNSHAGMCGYYSYNVCCNRIFSYINQTCNTSTSSILSFYQPNNTHAAEAYNYSWQLCAGYPTYPMECFIRKECLQNETCVVSLYSTTNSHLANCSYYENKLCCVMLSDLMVNSSSLQIPSPLIYGEEVTINVTVYNIGDTDAFNVNVSCFEDGRIFDSKIIDFIPKDGNANISCNWRVSCLRNISVKVDFSNVIKELNESNNEVTQQVSIIEYLNIIINHPADNQNIYRGEMVWLNSTVISSCGDLPPHTTYWFNESTFIGSGDNILWEIPLDDSILGRKTIYVFANSTENYIDGSNSINVVILNNLPIIKDIRFNISEAEVESGESIQIICEVFDMEDCRSWNDCHLDVNISILDANKTLPKWDNTTAEKIGNIFYRDYTAPYLPLGNYRAYCSVLDSDNGYNESYSSFLVFLNATVTIDLSKSYYWWDEEAKIYGSVKRRKSGTPVSLADVKVYLDNKLICTNFTHLDGSYYCNFMVPSSIGNYNILINVTDPDTGKYFVNSTLLSVKVAYGINETEIKREGQISCYEVPQLVINPDGSVKQVFVKVCISP